MVASSGARLLADARLASIAALCRGLHAGPNSERIRSAAIYANGAIEALAGSSDETAAAALPRLDRAAAILERAALSEEFDGALDAAILELKLATGVILINRPGADDEVEGGDRLGVPHRHSDHDLTETISRYLEESRRQARKAWYLMLLGVLLIASGLLLAFTLAKDLPPSQWQPWILILCLPLFSGLLWFEASRARRSAAEMERLGRQLAALPAYLGPLPHATRDLLRAAMIQRFFPRLLEDSDPLRESEWFPQVDDLIATVSPDLMARIVASTDTK